MYAKLVEAPKRQGRRRHAEEFKRQVIAAYLQPGISIAAVALALKDENGGVQSDNYATLAISRHHDVRLKSLGKIQCATLGTFKRAPTLEFLHDIHGNANFLNDTRQDQTHMPRTIIISWRTTCPTGIGSRWHCALVASIVNEPSTGSLFSLFFQSGFGQALLDIGNVFDCMGSSSSSITISYRQPNGLMLRL